MDKQEEKKEEVKPEQAQATDPFTAQVNLINLRVSDLMREVNAGFSMLFNANAGLYAENQTLKKENQELKKGGDKKAT